MAIIFDAFIKKYSRTVGQRNEIDDAMASTLSVQRVFGQQILDPDWTWKRFIYNQIFTVALFVYVLFGTADVLKHVTDMQMKAEAYYTLTITSVFPVKYLLFINNRDIFQRLYITAKIELFNLVKEDEERGAYVVKKCKFVKQLLFSMVLFTVTIYLVAAFYNYVTGTRATLSKTTSILMPMTTPFYEIGLILHTIYLFEITFTILVIDMWFVFLMFFYCMASDSLVKMLIVENREEDTVEMYQARLDDALRRFYFVHVKQTEYLNILNRMYKWATAVPVCNVFICLCTIMLVMSEDINWTFGSNFLPMCAEIFAYNWFGEQIKEKAMELNTALLEFDWPNMKLADKRNYLIIITYMKKEFGIKTVFGNDLSLLTMSAVMKASYQAFAVLKSIE